MKTDLSPQGNCLQAETPDVEKLAAAKLPHELRAGDTCPSCHSAILDYDGLLNLSCPDCGYAVGGCFT